MFCTSREQDTCDFEKRGCEGCFYFLDKNKNKLNQEGEDEHREETK